MIILEIILYSCTMLLFVQLLIHGINPNYVNLLKDIDERYKPYLGFFIIFYSLIWLIGGILSFSGIFILISSLLNLCFRDKKFTNNINLGLIVMVFLNKFYIRNDWWYNLINENLAVSIFLLVVYLFLIGKYHKLELS